jgi:hypothetical protein
MKELEQTALRTIYQNFPDAFFLINSVMHISKRNWREIFSKADIVDPDRLERTVRRMVAKADEDVGIPWRFSQYHKFEFHEFRQVMAEVSPTVFVCTNPNCGYAIDLGHKLRNSQLTQRDLFCKECSGLLKQVIHVFTHSTCGTVSQIELKKCPKCKKELRLRIFHSEFGRSRWECPECHNKSDLYMFCPKCSSSDDEARRMRPMPAGSAIKPSSIAVVDINSDMDWEEVAKKRLGIVTLTLRELILREYGSDPFMKMAAMEALNSSEIKRKQFYEAFLEKHPEYRKNPEEIIRNIGKDPCDDAKRLMAEYHGTLEVSEKYEAHIIPPPIESLIYREFRSAIRYMDNLPLQRLVYGYQVGSGDTSLAKIMTFDERNTSHVIAHRINTEAILVELVPQHVATWINNKLNLDIGETDLHKRLIGAQKNDIKHDKVYTSIEKLLHSLSHLLIRNSELYTGLSRDSLSEMIFTPVMAFAIFCQDGSELGALKTTCSSPNILSWFRQAKNAARECAYDPLCLHGNLREGAAACHACLFIAERNCNGFWNNSLDRRCVSDPIENKGYFDV